MPADSAELTKNQQIYTDFDEFLKSAITDYYEHGGKSNRGNFIALLIASGEAASLAMDSLKSGSGVRKIAVGAAGVVALRIGLRYALSGPLGILLAGATAASLIAYFVRNRGEIAGKITRYRGLVAALKESYAKLQSDHRDGRLDTQQRDLMIDGLMKRFLADLDADPAE